MAEAPEPFAAPVPVTDEHYVDLFVRVKVKVKKPDAYAYADRQVPSASVYVHEAVYEHLNLVGTFTSPEYGDEIGEVLGVEVLDSGYCGVADPHGDGPADGARIHKLSMSHTQGERPFHGYSLL